MVMRILHITNGLSEGGVESLLCDILPALISNECIIDIFNLSLNNRKALNKLYDFLKKENKFYWTIIAK